MKLFPWTKDFNSNLQKVVIAQVWTRLSGLDKEYYRPNIIFTLACNLGIPICTNALASKPRFDRPYGYFVRVLVERQGYAFFVDVEYENLPNF